MSGVKGRSGRKSTTEEHKRLKIIDKAWDVVYEALNKPDIEISDKLKAAVPIVVKDIKDKGEYTHKIDYTPDEQQEIDRIRRGLRGNIPNAINVN